MIPTEWMEFFDFSLDPDELDVRVTCELCGSYWSTDGKNLKSLIFLLNDHWCDH